MSANLYIDSNFYLILARLIKLIMESSLALAIILTFVGIIIFILISKNDLGVTTLKKDPEAHTTLIGSVAKGIPGTDILETGKVQITKDSTKNAVHN